MKDTSDIKFGWLICLDNMGLSLSRLNEDFPILSKTTGAKQSNSVIALISMLLKAIAKLQSKLMAIWDISRASLLALMNCEPGAYKKRMAQSNFTVSHSPALRTGPTKRSRKR